MPQGRREVRIRPKATFERPASVRRHARISKAAEYEEYISREYGWMVGKTVASVRPLTPSEVSDLGFYEASEVAFLVEFTDGTWFVPMSDDAGNSAGALLHPWR